MSIDDVRPPLPEDFVREIEALLGQQAPTFFASLEDAPALALRLNPLRADAQSVAEEFTQDRVPWEPLGRYLKAGSRPGVSIAHAAGAYYLQEASAMVSVSALDPQPGERVLDLCAAPGGKSTQIAARLSGKGPLVCNEPEFRRARILAANLERMGVPNACVVCAMPGTLAARWEGVFDAVLCDAPCSGEGMFRREPAARAQWTAASPEGCARRQAEILDCAARLVRPGGRLVYSTCTFNRTENEQTIAAFLRRHPEFAAEDFEINGLGVSTGGMIRVWPHMQRGDGHFAARLRSCADEAAGERPPVRAVPPRDAAALLSALEAEIGVLPRLPAWKLEIQGNSVCAVPEARPELTGLRVLSPGLELMRVGKNYVEPAHALAMALDAGNFQRSMALDAEQAKRYLAGETLPCPEALRGWTLLSWRNMPLGWGKACQGCMKNHLPRALRLKLNPF